METVKRKALEKAGWRIGDAADFLELSEDERQLLEVRLQLARAIRRQREARQWSQKQLGARLRTSQPRIAKIEQAASDVSLDQLVRAYTAAGGRFVIKFQEADCSEPASAQRKGRSAPVGRTNKRRSHIA